MEDEDWDEEYSVDDMMPIYRIKGWAWIVAIAFATVSEYWLIVQNSFENFQTAFGIWGGFWVWLIITLLTLAIIRFGFRRIRASRFIFTYLISTAIIGIIGFYISVWDYHIFNELINPYWEFQSDMPYVMITTQVVVISVLLLGTCEVPCVDAKITEQDEKEDFDIDW